MSLTPTTPNIGSAMDYLKTKEGKYAAGVGLVIGGVVLVKLPIVIAFLIGLATDGLHLIFLLAALGVVLSLLLSKSFWGAVGNFYRLMIRHTVGLMVELDPIGMQKNYLDSGREDKVRLDKAVEGVAGSKQGVEDRIKTNDDAIKENRGLIAAVDRTLAATTSQQERRKLGLDRERFVKEIGRRDASSENFRKTLAVIDQLYSKAVDMQQVADFQLEDLAAQIENDEYEREGLLDAYKALGPLQKILQGEPEAVKNFNMAKEFTVKDNAKKLGAIKNFSLYSEKYLRTMNIRDSAAVARGEKILADLDEQLKLSKGETETVPAVIPTAQAEPISISRKPPIDGDYLDLK